MSIVIGGRNHGKLRRHQARALIVAREIVAGRRHQKIVVAGITPGGGKTLMASLFANELADAGYINLVIVVVPNDDLRRQMLGDFHSHERELTRYLCQPSEFGKTVLPGMGKPFGIVVTYAALTNERMARKIAKLAAAHRTLVVFDECHHLATEKAWQRGAQIILDACRLALSMSGTLWRWDDEKIPMINYGEDHKALVDIKYSRSEALEERAVLPVEFKFFDGEAIYDYRSVPHQTRLSEAPLKEQARAVKTALKSHEYIEHFLSVSIADWAQYRERFYPSQLIGVFFRKDQARNAHGFACQRFPKFSSVRSLYDDPAADRALSGFRKGQYDALYTVRKAYEGLDVRAATHLIYMSDSRSWPFMDQTIARVTRFNPNCSLSWEEQRGYVFIPDDVKAREYVRNMMSEQEASYRDKERGAGEADRRGPSTFKPDRARDVTIGHGYQGHRCTPEEEIGLKALTEKVPTLRASLEDKLKLAYELSLVPLGPGESHAAE